MSVPARISIVTLGVRDLPHSVLFYEAIGWMRCASSMDEISWFRTADTYLGLFGWDDLAADANLVSPSRGPFGYGGYFADPDGHPWEVVYNPSFPIGPDGRITIP